MSQGEVIKEVRTSYSLCQPSPSQDGSESPVPRIVEIIKESHLQFMGDLGTVSLWGQASSFRGLKFPPNYSEKKKSVLSNPQWNSHHLDTISSHLLLSSPKRPPWEFYTLLCVSHTFFSNIKTLPALFPPVIGALSFHLGCTFWKDSTSLLVVSHHKQPACVSQ